MPHSTYRANLTAAEFPLLTEFHGRTVIIPSIDQNFSRQVNSPKNKDRDIGIPQLFYCHNVFPTDAGLTSIGYQTIATSPLDTDGTFYEMLFIRDTSENVAYFANTRSGRNYVLLNLGAGWIRTTDKAPGVEGIITSAHVNGQTYIMFGKNACYRYDFASNTLIATPLVGLTETLVLGICASNGYMIAWTATEVLWSSIIDPLDFIPSLATGAGGGGVQNAKAALTVVLPTNQGMTVYTKRNAVSMMYTGNAQYPFTYKEIGGAGGLEDPTLAAFDGNSTNSFTYTTAGLQEISNNDSSIVFPQVTDFIAGSQFEDFNEITLEFTRLSLASPFLKKIALIANRYLIVSYGVSQLTHAWVYDFGLARWGKIKLNHVDCFEYFYPSGEIVDIPKKNIGFLQADGTIIVGTISYDTTGSYGVVILGKYQLDRSHYLKITEIHLESVKAGNVLGVKLLSSIDGLATAVTTPTLARDVGTYRRYNANASGLNHSILIVGAFSLNSMELKITDAGIVR